jgi:hypothetical protein
MSDPRPLRILSSVLACALLLVGLGPLASVYAVTIYSYIDDRGDLVYTDNAGTIPEKFRSRVRSQERPDPVLPAPSAVQSVQRTLQKKANDWGWKMPSIEMDGSTPTQSRILTYAGGIAVVLLVCMYLSKSPFVRLLSVCLLLVLGIGTPVLLYVQDGGAMEKMKDKAATAGQAQHERLQSVTR